MDKILNRHDIEVILESLEYSRLNITHGKNSTYDIRRDKLAEIEGVMTKLRALHDEGEI